MPTPPAGAGYFTPGGESVLRNLTAQQAISNIPTAPRPPLPPRGLAPVTGPAGAAGAAGGTVVLPPAVATAAAIGVATYSGISLGEALRQGLAKDRPETFNYPDGSTGLVDYLRRRAQRLFPNQSVTNGTGEEIVVGREELPFPGGQCPVIYRVTATGQNSGAGASLQNFVTGPIRGTRVTSSGGTTSNNEPGYNFQAQNADGSWVILSFINMSQADAGTWSIQSLQRLDNQPDSCGDPPPVTVDTPTRQQAPPLAPPSSYPPLAPPQSPPETPKAPGRDDRPLSPPPNPTDPFNPIEPTEMEGTEVPNMPQLPGLPVPPPLFRPSGNEVFGPQPGGIKQPPPKVPPAPPKAPPNCGCNAPLLDALGTLDGKVTALAGAGGEVASTATILNRLNQMQQFAEGAWQSTRLQKVIDLLTLITSLHNAYYLSQDVALTVGEMTSLMLDVVGIDDEQGAPLDINAMLGSAIKNALEAALGEELVDDVGSALTKANRIYQSASNVIWTLRNLQDSTTDLLEIAANNTGKIGNALKLSKVVDALSYPYMSENYKASDTTRRRIQNMLDGIEQVDDTVGTLYAATASVRDIQEEFTELGNAKDRFATEIGTLAPRDTPENTPVRQSSDSANAASQPPDADPSDLDPANGTP